MWVSGVLTGIAAFTILGLQVWGFRRLEATITGFVAVIVFAFGLDLLKSRPSAAGVAHGMFVPQFAGSGSALLAVSIIGATVMPHVIYLHSSLTQKRIVGVNPAARRKIFRFEIVDITIAMGTAGVINLAMLATAAAVFHTRGMFGVGNDLGQVFAGPEPLPGRAQRDVLRPGPARVRDRVLLRRHHVRPARHAGLHPPADPDLRPPGHHDDPGPDRDRRWASTPPGRWSCPRSSCPSASRSRWSRCCSSPAAAS